MSFRAPLLPDLQPPGFWGLQRMQRQWSLRGATALRKLPRKLHTKSLRGISEPERSCYFPCLSTRTWSATAASFELQFHVAVSGYGWELLNRHDSVPRGVSPRSSSQVMSSVGNHSVPIYTLTTYTRRSIENLLCYSRTSISCSSRNISAGPLIDFQVEHEFRVVLAHLPLGKR